MSAHDVQHVPTANRVAGDQCDDRLGERPDELLQVEHVETRHAVAPDVAGVAPHALVAARAEGEVSLAGEQHAADILHLAYAHEGVDQLGGGFPAGNALRT